MKRTGLALISTCLLVGSSMLWLALPARAAATILITPSFGPPGSSVTILGTEFGVDEVVALCLGSVGCSNLGRPRANASGVFSRTSSVPTEGYVPGVNTVGACGRTSGCVTTVFIVIVPATTIATTTTAPETSTTIADAPTTTRATTTTTTARTTTTRQTPTTTGAPSTTPSFGPPPTTPSFGTPIPTQPDQSDPVLPGATATQQSDVTTTVMPSVPGSEVLTLFLTPSEPTDEGDPAAPQTPEGGEAAPLAAAEGGDDRRGLDQTEAILLWLATMGVAAGGLIAYEYRRR